MKFFVLFSGHTACEILVRLPGIKSMSPVVEEQSLTTGPPREPLVLLIKIEKYCVTYDVPQTLAPQLHSNS